MGSAATAVKIVDYQMVMQSIVKVVFRCLTPIMNTIMIFQHMMMLPKMIKIPHEHLNVQHRLEHIHEG